MKWIHHKKLRYSLTFVVLFGKCGAPITVWSASAILSGHGTCACAVFNWFINWLKFRKVNQIYEAQTQIQINLFSLNSLSLSQTNKHTHAQTHQLISPHLFNFPSHTCVHTHTCVYAATDLPVRVLDVLYWPLYWPRALPSGSLEQLLHKYVTMT